jgi:hypothetical protein
VRLAPPVVVAHWHHSTIFVQMIVADTIPKLFSAYTTSYFSAHLHTFIFSPTASTFFIALSSSDIAARFLFLSV